jgi:hypothetical protein
MLAARKWVFTARMLTDARSYLQVTMPNHLIFSAIDVARVVADAIRATSEQRRPTLEQLIKGGAYNDNLDLNEQIEKALEKASHRSFIS